LTKKEGNILSTFVVDITYSMLHVDSIDVALHNHCRLSSCLTNFTGETEKLLEKSV